MQHPDEGTIHAWLDGALSPEEGAALEAHAAACTECSAVIAEARGLIAASSRIVSALDIVPGGVIRARKPAGRRWYASTQLRAAAAVLFVAGASMMLLRDRNTGSVEDLSQTVMSEIAPEPAHVSPIPEGAATATDSPVAAPSAASEQRIAETKGLGERRAEADDRVSGQLSTQAAAKVSTGAAVADAAAPTISAPAIPAPPPVSTPQATAGNVAAARTAPTTLLRDSSARRVFSESRELSNVVVTGVASDFAKKDSLIVISVDTAMGYTAVRYRTATGVDVLLTETRTDRGRERSRVQLRASPQAAAATPPPAQSRPDSLPITTIEWFDASRTRRFVLSGRVTRDALLKVREQIESSRLNPQD